MPLRPTILLGMRRQMEKLHMPGGPRASCHRSRRIIIVASGGTQRSGSSSLGSPAAGGPTPGNPTSGSTTPGNPTPGGPRPGISTSRATSQMPTRSYLLGSREPWGAAGLRDVRDRAARVCLRVPGLSAPGMRGLSKCQEREEAGGQGILGAVVNRRSG